MNEINEKFFKVNLLFNLHAVGRGSRIHFSLSYFQQNILRYVNIIEIFLKNIYDKNSVLTPMLSGFF